MTFKPNGVVTITTDFGHKGPFIGTMKGQILCRLPDARIVDVTHDVLVHWPAEAGFWLGRAYRYFPPGTVHIAVVDPGVGTGRELIVVDVGEHVFVGPDNGLLAPVIDRARGPTVYLVAAAALADIGVSNPSATFHGRDIFAPLAAEIAAGRLAPANVGPTTDEWVPSWVDPAALVDGQINGVVITIDHFGNLITNIERSMMTRINDPQVHVGGKTAPLRTTYGDVKPGALVALVNSFDVLEVACSQGDASRTLGVGRGGAVRVTSHAD